MNFVYKVEDKDVNRCYRFAEDLYERDAASARNFGTKMIRSKEDYISDHVRGKVAEFGFRQFLNDNLQVDFEVDLNVYDGHHNHDNGNDLATIYLGGQSYKFGFKTDVKGIAANSSWLLIEDHKFWAQIYVVCKALNIPSGYEFEEDPYRYRGMDWDIRVEGYTYNKDIYSLEENLPWFGFKKDERLFSKSAISGFKSIKNDVQPKEFTRLLSERLHEFEDMNKAYIGSPLVAKLNYGYPVGWLRNDQTDWIKFKEIIKKYSELEK